MHATDMTIDGKDFGNHTLLSLRSPPPRHGMMTIAEVEVLASLVALVAPTVVLAVVLVAQMVVRMMLRKTPKAMINTLGLLMMTLRRVRIKCLMKRTVRAPSVP